MSSSLSPQVFSILSTLVEERLGLHYGIEDLEIFADKLLSRAREAGFESALDYYYFLRYDPGAAAELDALADALVVGETYFFRELDALRAAAVHVIAPAVEERGAARVWCAACATGEEPLSLAMVLEELGIREQCRIVATDVSARALGKAREGVYGSRSLRALPPHPTPANFSERLGAIAAASLTRDPVTANVGGTSRLSATSSGSRASRALVDSIEYKQLNLLDSAGITALGSFDLILCRNVLIYFSDLTVKDVVTSLARVLKPTGRVIVGASESLLRFGTVLRCEERGGAFLYATSPKETA